MSAYQPMRGVRVHCPWRSFPVPHVRTVRTARRSHTHDDLRITVPFSLAGALLKAQSLSRLCVALRRQVASLQAELLEANATASVIAASDAHCGSAAAAAAQAPIAAQPASTQREITAIEAELQTLIGGGASGASFLAIVEKRAATAAEEDDLSSTSNPCVKRSSSGGRLDETEQQVSSPFLCFSLALSFEPVCSELVSRASHRSSASNRLPTAGNLSAPFALCGLVITDRERETRATAISGFVPTRHDLAMPGSLGCS